MLVEIFGICCSILIVCSLLMNGEVQMRQVNIIGSVLLIVYGICIASLTTIVLNTCASVINITKLYKIQHQKVPADSNWRIGTKDEQYGGIITDIRTLAVGTTFFVCNGCWTATVKRDLLGKYFVLKGETRKHRLNKSSPCLLSIFISKE